MNSQEVLSLYEAVATLTGQMLTAARNGDWEQLIMLESHCSMHITTLQSGEAPAPLTGAARERKAQIIQKILADDREIRTITEPWMTQLSLLINSTGTSRKLVQAYGANRTR